MRRRVREGVSGLVSGLVIMLAACGSAGNSGGGEGNQTPQTFTLTVGSTNPSSGAAITASPADNSGKSSGTTPFTLTYNSGTAVTLTASSTANNDTFSIWSGCNTPKGATCLIKVNGTATVSAAYLATPAVTVTPAASSMAANQPVQVAVAVGGSSGNATGTVTLTSGTYASAATTLTHGGATIVIPAGTLSTGSNTLKATYTPDTAGATAYTTASGTAGVTITLLTPGVNVSPASQSLTLAQTLSVTVTVNGGSGNATPTGSVALSGGSYASGAATLTGGAVSITVPAYALAYGSDKLSATYTPDAASSWLYGNASGAATVSAAKATPAVIVTPGSTSTSTAQALDVTVTVSGGSGAPAATGTVQLSGGGFSSLLTLASGTASTTIPAGSLALGNDALSATYTPDSASSSVYNTASGTSGTISVVTMSTVAVDLSSNLATVNSQFLGMNLADWYDVVANASSINSAFAEAGATTVRWPGGSWADDFHWGMGGAVPFVCGNTISNNNTFAQFVDSIVKAGGYDLALTANYGSDTTCTNPGTPAEAAAWITAAEQDGIHVSHMTVGNEEYGDWEHDYHAIQHDPATYAGAVAGTNGYYNQIKAADSSTLVGVDVDAGSTVDSVTADWDPIVLANAKGYYDFVEFHYYAQEPGQENDTYLVHNAAQDLTKNLQTLKAELGAAGLPNTPIFVGELGSVSSSPGKQSWSITQGLYAGQALGEMMNQGVERVTWWIGFGNCNGTAGNMSSSLYGWQSFGAYNVFSDGSTDSGPTCTGGGAIGTMSPTAHAFELFRNMALGGETALSASVTGDTTNIRAYAVTHSGGTALMLFNLNETTSLPVTVTLAGLTSAHDVQVITYDKGLYDQSNPANSNGVQWPDATTNDMGAQSLPVILTLTPWSMNVVIVE